MKLFHVRFDLTRDMRAQELDLASCLGHSSVDVIIMRKKGVWEDWHCRL
jgi:hypothetical protein